MSREDRTVAESPTGGPPPTMGCPECGAMLPTLGDGPDGPWRQTNCYTHPDVAPVPYEEALRMKKERERARDQRRAVVDAAMLRALAALVESSGEPLREWGGGGDGVSSPGLQSEVRRRSS